jgi:hypothetical protein
MYVAPPSDPNRNLSRNVEFIVRVRTLVRVNDRPAEMNLGRDPARWPVGMQKQKSSKAA